MSGENSNGGFGEITSGGYNCRPRDAGHPAPVGSIAGDSLWQRIEAEIALAGRLPRQKPKDKGNLYTLHEPEVYCISKGKARMRYETGSKVSVATTRKDGFVMRIRSMLGNPYDGHTLREALEQVAFLSKIRPKQAFVDRGYHGLGVETTTGYIAGQKLDDAWPPRALRHQGHARGSDPCRPLPLRPQRSHDPRPPQSTVIDQLFTNFFARLA